MKVYICIFLFTFTFTQSETYKTLIFKYLHYLMHEFYNIGHTKHQKNTKKHGVGEARRYGCRIYAPTPEFQSGFSGRESYIYTQNTLPFQSTLKPTTTNTQHPSLPPTLLQTNPKQISKQSPTTRHAKVLLQIPRHYCKNKFRTTQKHYYNKFRNFPRP